MAADPTVLVLSGDPLLNEARKRFERCAEWEANFRQRFIADMKFRHGDSDNGYQWPSGIRQSRDISNKPCLTMNLIKSHNLMISNEARKNKSSVKFIGTGNGATQETANVYKDLMRNIEFRSRAQDTYTMARGFQIDGGIGYWRLVTDYVDEDSFDQEIGIIPVDDPLSIYLDPDAKQKNKSDCTFAFAFDDIPRGTFDDAYPKYAGMIGKDPMGITGGDDWLSMEYMRICEYFFVESEKDLLISFVTSTSERKTIRESLLPKAARKILDDPLTKTREIDVKTIRWKLIAGDQVIDSTDWPGKYIPIIPCIGEEFVLDGVMDRKGHTRDMKDPQRMYNYNSSAQVEIVALQTKTPWKAPAKAIEEHESMWNTANSTNHSVLIYNHADDEGNPIPPPERTDPPQASPGFQAGMETAFNQMMMTSGQWQNQMGMGGNERTGAAIQGRQRQGDTATFHFPDNYESALVYTGMQVADLIPKVYDTKRIMQVLAEDGTDYILELDPAAKQHYQQEVAHDGIVVKRIFNPSMGRYDVAPNVGPEYGTKRQDTVDALTLILTQAPALTGLIGDILLGSMEFDKAQEAALRLRRMVPPQALGNGPSPQEQKLQEQVQSLGQMLEKSLQVQGKDQLKLVGKEQMRDIDVYEAETKRLAAVAKLLPTDPQGLAEMIHQLLHETLNTTLGPIIEANRNNLDVDDEGEKGEGASDTPAVNVPPPPAHLGAQKAPDGQWYMLDPTRKGKYLKIAPLAQDKNPGGRA